MSGKGLARISPSQDIINFVNECLSFLSQLHVLMDS